MDHLFDVSGTVAVITGGLGQLGAAYAAAFLERGARVAILDLDVVRRFPAVDALAPWRDDPALLVLEADVTDRNSLEACHKAILGRLGAVTVLVNNAAIDTPPDSPAAAETGPFEAYPETSWDRVMAVNIKGTMLCSQVFGAAMAEHGTGSIINISSIYGMVSPDQNLYEYRRMRGEVFFKPAAYATSKAAIFNLTRYLATYWARGGVRVNTLTLAGVFNHQDQSFLDGYSSRIPIGRMALPTDYIGPVLFLASPASAYMTGANLVVDGGWTAI